MPNVAAINTAFRAAQLGDPGLLRTVAPQLTPADLASFDDNGQTMHLVALREFLVRVLIESPAEMIAWASECAIEMVKLGAPCKSRQEPGKVGQTAMYWFLNGTWDDSPHAPAVANLMASYLAYGFMRADELVPASPSDDQDGPGLRRALAVAVDSGNCEAVRLLMRAGADPDQAALGTGYSTLEDFARSRTQAYGLQERRPDLYEMVAATVASERLLSVVRKCAASDQAATPAAPRRGPAA